MASGTDDSGRRMVAEERKRESLRNRLDTFYGIDPTGTIDRNDPRFLSPATTMVEGERGTEAFSGTQFDEEAYNREVSALGSRAAEARKQMAAEEEEIGGSTREYYADQLRRAAERAERMNRFALADRGLLKGSVDIDTGEELQRARTEGGTRVEDQTRAALNALRAQREQERSTSTQLIQAGVGEDAVASASAGLNRALENARAREKADITSDLFSTVANASYLQNDPTALAAQRYQQRLKTFYPTTSTSSGRVTRG